ncbi:MAG: hypothetical protein WBA23_06550, partial [Tunicatimonas sp.]
MIIIYLDKNYQNEVSKIVGSVPRLSELVTITTEDALAANIIVDERGITLPLVWDNSAPPFLMSSPAPLHVEVLLGYIFITLGNYAEAQNYLAQHTKLYNEVMSLGCLQTNQSLPIEVASTFNGEKYRDQHNKALLQQYGLWPTSVTLADVQQTYQEALATAPDQEHYAFTLRQYATLLLDTNQGQKAEELLQQHLAQHLSEEASYALKSVLTSTKMAQLSVP